MENKNIRRFILFIVVVVLLVLGLKAKAQSFDYPIEVDWSKGLSKVSLRLSEDNPEYLEAEQIIVSSVFSDRLIIPAKKNARNRVPLMSRKEFKLLCQAGETFDIEFYKEGIIIYRLTVIPTKDETKFYYQEVGGSNWIGWLR